MLTIAPFNFRSISSVARFKPQRPGPPSTPRRFRSLSTRQRCFSAAFSLSGLSRTVCGFRSSAFVGFSRCSGWSEVVVESSQMASPKHMSELTEDLSRLSASLEELSSETQGLAKVNVENLESQHSPASEKEELAGMDVGKTEGQDVDKIEGHFDVGEAHQVPVERNVSTLEDEMAEEGSRTPGKVEEEQNALDEVLGQLDLGKIEGHEGDETDDLGKMTEIGFQTKEVGKTEESRQGPSLLEQNIARLEASFGPEGHVGIVGGTEGKSIAEQGIAAKAGKNEEDEGDETEMSKLGFQTKEVGKTEESSQGPSLLEQNIAKLEDSFGPEGHVGIVGKTEGKSIAKEGLGTKVGKIENQDTLSALEENIRKLEESFGPEGHVGIVGKTEGKEFVSTSRSFAESKREGIFDHGNKSDLGSTGSQNPAGQVEGFVGKGEDVGKSESQKIAGKVEGCDGEDVGKSESQKAAGKVEGFVGEDVGKSESQKAAGKVEGFVGEDVGKSESQKAAGKVEGFAGKGKEKVQTGESETDAETLQDAGKTQSEIHSQQESETRGKVSRDDEISVSEEKSGMGNLAGKTETHPSETHGNEPLKCVIHLASKGPQEAKYLDKLQGGEELRLPDGFVVISSDEGTDSASKEGFNVNVYFMNLFTSQFGRLVLHTPVIPSTHTLLSQNFHAFPAGTICTAGSQLQGRGRAGNSWNSPQGCLMFSFTIQMANGRLVPFLQYVVSLAVIQAVEEHCKSIECPVPDLRIKWPNDLYANGVKIGGVLCTSSYRDKTFNIVVGVGLNVGNREPTTCLEALIEELGGQSVSIQHEQLLAAVMAKFEALNSVFQDQGFLPLQNEYYSKWLHTGQRVTLEEKEAETSSVSHAPVTIQGLTPTGYLLATDDGGERYELHPDGNSFDFLKGLVRQKLSS